VTKFDEAFGNLRRGPWNASVNDVPQQRGPSDGQMESTGWLSDDSVSSDVIQASAVIASKISAGAVETDKLAANAVTAAKIAAGTITANEIAANTITAAKIAANTITASEIAANTLTANEIAASAITASEIAADAVTTTKILAGNVVSSKIELTISGKNFGANSGTASAPGVYFDSDNDTGMYLGATGNIVIASSSGSTSFSVNSTSNISKNPLYPALDNTYPLGTGVARWSEVFAANGTINTSDERLKQDIEDSPLALDFVRSLRPVSYRWRATPDAPVHRDDDETVARDRAPLVAGIEEIRRRQAAGVLDDETGNARVEDLRKQLRDLRGPAVLPAKRPGRRRHFGLIAQEVKSALDDAGQDAAFWRQEADSGMQSLNYSELIAPLIAAVQELDAELQELKQALHQKHDQGEGDG
jgi:hypothetical protein